MTRAVAVLCVSALLAGCGQHGWFRDRGHDYLQVTVGQPLAYPDGVPALATQELYPVPAPEQRRRAADGRMDVPKPPQVVDLAEPKDGPAAALPPGGAGGGITRSADGNGFPVLMLDTGFDWAWQRVGDALPKVRGLKVDDLDRERGIYFVVVDGRRADNGEPFQLKLNYTANGIQVALQVDEDAMASRDLAEPLMASLEEALR